MWKQIRRRIGNRQAPEQMHRQPGSIDLLTDEEFVEYLYRNLLGRHPDPGGRAAQLAYLQEGNSRAGLVINMVSSPEFIFRTVRDNIKDYVKLVPIIDDRLASYRVESNRSGTERCRFFVAGGPADYDWLEGKIIGNGYYERPGVWSFNIDEDKRMLADMIAGFAPATVLDIGCANGAVLKCLADKGIYGEGIDLSRLALDMAPDEIRDRIHLGDLLSLALPRRFDMVVALDIFEHLNPNKLDAYIRKIFDLLEEGGHLFTNIPAFGADDVYGEVFPIDYPIWDDDVRAGRIFRAVPVDDYGYPKNGHIINAASDWWVASFARHGFVRQQDTERRIHAAHAAALDLFPARRSFYVLVKKGAAETA